MSQIPIFKFAIRADLNGNTHFLPSRGTPKSTGWDVRAAIQSSMVVKPGEYVKIPLGFRVLPPDGWWLDLHPRSSTFVKKHIHSLYGVIDEDYEGECTFCGQYIPEGLVSDQSDLVIDFGDAIGQIIPVRREEMIVQETTNESLDRAYRTRNALRGVGGFGSTGK